MNNSLGAVADAGKGLRAARQTPGTGRGRGNPASTWQPGCGSWPPRQHRPPLLQGPQTPPGGATVPETLLAPGCLSPFA